MSNAPDHYEVYYADKLWNLLPAIYRAEDTDQFGANGPLREMINRIGVQAAILRRSIDRMWEDQSIETCDDWVIPYIGDPLATNLVAGLDPRGQRLDVAKTIYYRRRKGTVAILEEIAANITGWEAKTVEFFRRMGRTRHGLDPPIGPSLYASDPIATLQVAEGLAGRLTHTGIGGFADLRNVYGASKAHTAFDEFFHTADIRPGLGRSGWYNIPRLGVFLWRLKSYPLGSGVTGPVTPVPVKSCTGWYSFDPTGRDIPLFAAGRSTDAYGSQWISPVESQLPTPISQQLLDANGTASGNASATRLYPDALAVYSTTITPPALELVQASQLQIRPERGRFEHLLSPPTVESNLVVAYHYGFSSDIGVGPYDRRIDAIAIATPAPNAAIHGGGAALAGGAPSMGTVTIDDSLTYAGAADVTVHGQLTLTAKNQERPLIRLSAPPSQWTINGAPSSCLILDGLFISGSDVVLRGDFDSVTLNCCTFDPGSAAAGSSSLGSPPGPLFAVATDGRDLVPTRLWIEGKVKTLTIDRCILGPIRTRGGGFVETLTVSNSILQAIATSGPGPIQPDAVKDPSRFERRLQLGQDPVSALLLKLSPEIGALLGSGGSPPFALSPPSTELLPQLLQLINDHLLAGPSIYDAQAFSAVPLSRETMKLLQDTPAYGLVFELNRRLLEDAFPLELADAALAFGDGTIILSRCTILGRLIAHRLQASECILQDLAQVDNAQDGCVRFTAWADGSLLPRKFESVPIPQQAPLFTSVDFGQPGYCQLLPLVNAAIQPDTTASSGRMNTISAGAEDGSEMGAFARDKNPIKERALLIKYQEFMPAGLVPVIVYVT
ncbi:MAG: hypothetical protein M3178_00975 [Pseudomonadota bacterium]|nr:hypothetical protein [Pseudomonadota bacterium]